MRRILAFTFAVTACGEPDTGTDTESDFDLTADTDHGETLPLASTTVGGAPYFGGTGLVVADGYAVWVDTQGDILRVSTDGGAVTTLVADQASVLAVAVSAERTWWTLFSGGVWDLNGTEVSEHTGITGPCGLAATDDGVVATDLAGGVYAVSTRGRPQRLSDDEVWSAGVAVAGGDVYWVNTGEFGRDGTIWEVAESGAEPVAIAEAQTYPTGVVVHAGYVWWTNAGFGTTAGSLSRAPLGGGAVEVVVDDQTGAQAIAAGGDYVCWTIALDGEPGAVRCVPVAGGDPVEIGSGTSVQSAVACDEEYVYWGERETLWRTLLP